MKTAEMILKIVGLVMTAAGIVVTAVIESRPKKLTDKDKNDIVDGIVNSLKDRDAQTDIA